MAQTFQDIARLTALFLSQKEDRETVLVKKTLKSEPFLKDLPSPKKSTQKAPPLQVKAQEKAPEIISKEEQAPKIVPLQSVSLFSRLSNKVKKGCPDLRIKESLDIKPATIPDCDILFLTNAILEDVYQSLVKAVDSHFGVIETVTFENGLINDLNIRHFKLILAAPSVKTIKSFTNLVKFLPLKQQGFIGSSPVLFLETAQNLNQNPSNKHLLWQKIKTILA
jgi:hypothetical protein